MIYNQSNQKKIKLKQNKFIVYKNNKFKYNFLIIYISKKNNFYFFLLINFQQI